VASPGEEAVSRAVGVSAIDSATVPKGLSAYWDKVRSGEALVVGINRRYPPFGIPIDTTQRTDGGPELAGFDVDLALHLGETLGVPVVLKGITSQEAMDRLNDGTIDLAIAGLTRTVFRAAQVNFTDPYLVVSQAALIERRYVEGSRGTDEERRRDTLESYDDLRALTGLRIGAVKWTRPHRLAEHRFPGARVIAYETAAAMSQALIDGDVNALVHDDPYVRVWPRFNSKHAGRFRALLKPVTAEPISIAMRKGDLEFLRFLDAYVGEVRQDGTIEGIYRRQFVDAEWFETAEKGGEE
jgi:polar amino acid transport system substrate-binding protein